MDGRGAVRERRAAFRSIGAAAAMGGAAAMGIVKGVGFPWAGVLFI